ncbi:beta strand repeat-containing protein [Flavobacterium sp.]|uniref:beta strand repeat-containing protein n=1 Tax=Flavobacterium sp. TaxID=239 RepID=UPI003750CFF5
MKKTLLLLLFVISVANAQVGVGTITPNGALDITSANDGVLIPRIALSATNVATVLTPTTSELVYNTATAGAGITAVTPGFYYWNGASWIRISTGQNSDWTLLGNSGTVAATNFVGTTDAIDFVTRTNNTEKTRVTSAGNVGIGTPTPAAKLDVAAAATAVNTVVNATGSINDYLQFNIQNTSTGIQAQSGYSATADNGTATTGFAWLGINNSTFNFPTAYNIGGVNDVSYVGSGQDMYVANANNTKSIIFSTGRAATPFFNERMRITNAGNVGIGTTLPTGLLDLTATDRGMVPPRIALTDSSLQAPVINPQGGAIPAGTTIYNTATAGVSPNNVGPGLYFWNGTRWIAFAGSAGGLDWSLTGNASTTPGTFAAPGVNYLGTSDATALHITTNNTPRIQIASSGNTGIGVAATGVDLVSITNSSNTNQRGLLVNNSSTLASARGVSIVQSGSTTGSTALIANNTNTNLDGLGAIISGQNVGLTSLANSGTTSNGTSYGLAGFGKTAVTGTGVAGIGQGGTTASSFAGIGSGVAATGADLGLSAFATTTTGARNAARFDALTATATLGDDPAASIAGFATAVDVGGGAVNIRDVSYGGYFTSGTGTSFAYVGANLSANVGGSTNYKIIGTGTVSTIVSSDKANDSKRIMFAPEAPEVLFEDYGVGQLNNGQVTIKVDPIFSKNIFVDSKHPLKVFVQLEGDCNGVFVTSKSKDGFTVKELNGGKSNVSFSWHIIGNRADEKDATGKTVNYQLLRYPEAPTALPTPELKQVRLEKVKDL